VRGAPPLGDANARLDWNPQQLIRFVPESFRLTVSRSNWVRLSGHGCHRGVRGAPGRACEARHPWRGEPERCGDAIAGEGRTTKTFDSGTNLIFRFWYTPYDSGTSFIKCCGFQPESRPRGGRVYGPGAPGRACEARPPLATAMPTPLPVQGLGFDARPSLATRTPSAAAMPTPVQGLGLRV